MRNRRWPAVERSGGTGRAAVASCLAVTALVLLITSGAPAQESHRPVPADLLQKAWSQGTVRVIVELGNVGAVPEGTLPGPAAVAAQRARIAADRAVLRSTLQGLRHRVLREFRTLPYVGLEVDYDTLRVLDAVPGLATLVHEDVLLRPMLAQSTPLIKAPDAWNAGWDGTGQVIAIIDTGVDKNHSFLAGRVIEEACYDSSGVSTCPNGLSSDTGPGAGVPCTFAADCFHGTHVAGIAAGSGPSFDGVAPGATIIAIQVFHRVDDPGACGGSAPCALASSMDLVAALERIHELSETHPIAAANMSLGSGGHTAPCDGAVPAMDLAIGNLRSNGIATVVASGNDGFLFRISWPACISTAISVGATGDGSGGWPTDQVTWFSNSADFLSLLAPGAEINSSVPGGGFSSASGTSMAAPHVAGAWAIAKQSSPGASVSDVLAGLQNTGKRITDVNDVTTSRIAATLLQFSASAYSVGEAGSTATITVTRSGSTFGPTFAPLTVDYETSAASAIPGEDYVEASGTLEFNAGEMSKTFTVAILNDTKADGQRKLNLALSNPGGGALLGSRDTAELAIVDNDVAGTVQFSTSAYSVGEKAGFATITVNRSGGSAGPVTIQYSTSDGTGHAGEDYQHATGTLTFDATGPGATSQTFTVPVIDNGDSDGNRTVMLTLHTPGGGVTLGGQKTATLTIVDDEVALQFSQATYSVNEGSGSLTVTVTRTGPVGPPVGVTYTVLPGSASPGADYGGIHTGVLTFPANQSGAQTFRITILNDKLAEGPETGLLQLSSPTGALLGPRQTAVFTIVDDDAGGAFRFGSSTYSVGETAATVSVQVTRSSGSAGNGKVRVVSTGDGTAVPGVHYVPVDQVLSFPADQPNQTVTITLLPAANNATVDALRTIKLALQSPEPPGLSSIGTPSSTTVTIGDNDVAGSIQFGQTSVSVLESAANAVIMVTRNGGAAMGVGATWEITSVGNATLGVDYAEPVSYALSFDSGPTQPISIPLLNPPGAHAPRTLQVKLKDPAGGAKLAGSTTATITLLSDTVGFQLDKASYSVATEGTGSLTVTVLRTGPTQPAVAVTIATVDPPAGDAGTAIPGTDYTPASMLLTFGAGQTSRAFTIPLKNDMQLDGARTLKLRLSNPTGGAELGQPAEATATLGDDDLAGTFRFTTGTLTMTEGANGSVVATITVARSGGSGGTVQVPWSVIDGTATTGVSADPGVDVLLAPSGTLTFGPNELSKKIEATILSDSEVEPNETVKLALGTPTPGGALGSPSELTLVVADGDRRGTIQFTAPLISVAEANLVATIAVTRTGNLADPVTVDWAITGGSATRGDAPGVDVDYVAPTGGTLSFAAGQSTPTVPLTIAVNFDAIADGTETVELTLGAPSAGWALGTVPSTIVSLVEGAVQFAPLSPVSEGSGSANITITRTGVTTQPVTVSYTTGSPGSATPAPTANACSPGADYRPVSGSQTFSPGQTTRTFSVPLCGDGIVEGDETLTLTLAVVSGPAIIGATGDAATLTITENDAAGAIRFSSATYSASEGQGNATLTVTRTGGGTGVTVHWAIDDVASTAHHGEDYTGPLEGDIDFGNLTSKSLVIPLLNTSAADGPRTIVVALSNPLPAGLASLGGGPTQATLTINDNEPTLRLNSASYVIGETSANLSVTVLRSGPASAPASVKLVPQTISSATGGTCNTSGVDFGAAVIDVEIPAGQGSRTVQVPICQDTWADGPETFGLALQDPGGATLATPAAATVTITDNEVPGTLKWSAADASGVEGTTLLLTVTRTSGTASDITVEVTAHDGDDDTPGADAQAGVDYEVVTASPLSFGLNATTQTVEISLLPRDGVQGPRAFRVTLHDPAGGPGVALGSPATATVWILDSN